MNDAKEGARVADIENWIKFHEDHIKGEQHLIDCLRQERAELLCPFKVGDRLINDKGEKATLATIEAHDEGTGYSLLGRFDDQQPTDRAVFFLLACHNWRLLVAKP